MTLVALCVALAFCFTGGLLAMFAQIAAGALLMAYALTGFAVLHTLTLALRSRAVWLGCSYAVIVVLRLAGARHGRARAGRRRFRTSRALSCARGRRPYRRPEIPHFNSNPIRIIQRRTNMEVILLERVAKLGQMGEVVKVRDGFARNFLLKRGKALRATADNRAKFDGMKAELEANNLQAKGEASKVAEKIDGRNRDRPARRRNPASCSARSRCATSSPAFAADGITISRSQVWLDSPIKTIGKHKMTIAVHPEVETSITVTVARSADEAERIKRGEDISTRQEDQDAAAEAIAAAGEFFDPEAQHDDVAAAGCRSHEK